MRRRGSSVIAYLLTTALVAGSLPVPVSAAAEYVGQVSFAGIAVPGAQVTATQGETQLTTTTDAQGVFRIANIADGGWTFRVEMRGFSTLSRDVTIGPDAQPMMWELSLLPFE